MPVTPSSLSATYRRENTTYAVTWRSTGPVEVTGLANVAELLGIQAASLRVYLSSGKARKGLVRRNPQTGETDVVTVAVLRVAELLPKPEAAAQPKRKSPGRPRKPVLERDQAPVDTPTDWAAVRAKHKR